jgi:hypothetical protein
MTITLTSSYGDVRIENVQSIRLLGPGAVVTRTFGNSEVVHRGVVRFAVEPFEFPSSMSMADEALAEHGGDRAAAIAALVEHVTYHPTARPTEYWAAVAELKRKDGER